ncbi:hypothetical protein [Spirosoma arcticum]
MVIKVELKRLPAPGRPGDAEYWPPDSEPPESTGRNATALASHLARG